MTRPARVAIDTGFVDELLALRQKRPRDAECAEMAVVSSVLEGGADIEEIQATARHLESCETCRELVQAFRGMDEAPRAEGVKRTPERAGSPWLRRLVWTAAALGLLAGGGLLARFVLFQDDRGGASSRFVLKGQADTLAVAVERSGVRFAVKPGDRLRPGDRLGFFYSAKADGYLALFSLDSTGASTLLHPAGDRLSGPVQAGHQLPLPNNATIRNLEGCEWLVAVFSDRPLSLGAIQDHLGAGLQAPRKRCELDVEIPGARTVWIFPLR